MGAEQAEVLSRQSCVPQRTRCIQTPAILGEGEAMFAAKEVMASSDFEGGRRGRVGVEMRQISFLGGSPEFEYPTLPAVHIWANSEHGASFLIPEGENEPGATHRAV